MKKEFQEELLKFARKTIECAFSHKGYSLKNIQKEVPSEFDEKRGVFVTLHKQGNLRGCIGYIYPIKSIYEGVRENALNAAFNDSRFEPLTEEELPEIKIEISVLTPPKQLQFSTPEELLKKLRPNVDGVILQNRGYQSTFLPQVWEELSDPMEFLEHLSLKAGLNNNAWKTATIHTYQVEAFEEV